MASFTPVGVLYGTLQPSSATLYGELTVTETIACSFEFGQMITLANTVFTYRGAVAAKSDLPATAENGDTYFVEDEETNYAWDGYEWRDIGGNTMAEALTEDEISYLQGLIN